MKNTKDSPSVVNYQRPDHGRRIIIMKKIFPSFLAALVMTVVYAVNSYAWGLAVHAIINDNLCEKSESLCLNETYGGFVSDFANDLYASYFYANHLMMQTHTDPLPVWDLAELDKEKALARGLVSHSEKVDGENFGVDSSAHFLSRTQSYGEGYVIAKARVLQPILEYVLWLNGIEFEDPSIVLGISHIFVEYAFDIALTQDDPSIAQKIFDAAVGRCGSVKNLLVNAYAEELAGSSDLDYKDAAKFIKKSEEAFRKNTVLYGYALLQDFDTAFGMVSEQIADIGEAYLQLVAPDMSLTREQILQIIWFGLSESLLNPDILNPVELMEEISATAEFVGINLFTEGIYY